MCRLYSPIPRTPIDKPPPRNRDYSRDPNIKALKRRGFNNHGSTFPPLKEEEAVLNLKSLEKCSNLNEEEARKA